MGWENYPSMKEEEGKALLLAAQSGDFTARERLCAAHMGLVGSIVRRFRSSGRERDDLFQVGCLGLLKAIEHFDFSYQVCFSTYAVPLIMGEIRRYLRDDAPLKVSRQLKERALLIDRCRSQLYQQNGQEPDLALVAEACRLSRQDVVAALDAVRPPISLQEARSNQNGDRQELEESLSSPVEIGEEVLDRLTLIKLLESLPQRLSYILRCRYFAERTQADLAMELGISQVQVSRLEKKALAMLRKEMGEVS
ncbi:MAG: sigma-70 family RNA polymerase sigma factor [Firmicutes bacterium]|nr:sigma-70 family RNA polymerase sigma factor [Bacillota bacterium]